MKSYNDMDPNNNPLAKILEFLSNLFVCCLITVIASALGYFMTDDEFLKGEWLGIGLFALVLVLMISTLIKSFFSKEDFDEMKKEAERMLEEMEKNQENEDK